MSGWNFKDKSLPGWAEKWSMNAQISIAYYRRLVHVERNWKEDKQSLIKRKHI